MSASRAGNSLPPGPAACHRSAEHRALTAGHHVPDMHLDQPGHAGHGAHLGRAQGIERKPVNPGQR